jgi:Protein of unknown function (DUF3352)
VQGDYALGLLPRPEQTLPDWVFIAERTPTAISAIQRLDAKAQQQGFSSGTLQLAGQTVTAWTKLIPSQADQAVPLQLQAAVQGVHATVDNFEIFTPSIAAMQMALQAPAVNTNSQYQQILNALPEPRAGTFYVNWQQNQALLTRSLPVLKWVNLIGKPIVDHLQSVAVSSQPSDAGQRRGVILIQLGHSGQHLS